MGILNNTHLELKNINLDDVKFDDDDTETVIHVKLMALYNIYTTQSMLKRHKQRINAWRMTSY